MAILYLQVRRKGAGKNNKTCLYGGTEGNNEVRTEGMSCKASPVKDNKEKRGPQQGGKREKKEAKGEK